MLRLFLELSSYLSILCVFVGDTLLLDYSQICLFIILVHIIQINARATYGLSYGGTSPHIFLQDRNVSSTADALIVMNNNFNGQPSDVKDWKLYLPKAYHPLLLQQHREILRKAKRGVSSTSPVSHKGKNSICSSLV